MAATTNQAKDPITAKVFVDATRRPGGAAWGAVAIVPGRKPHCMTGTLRTIKNTNILELQALQQAARATKDWLFRHALNASLVVLHSDNQGIAEKMAEEFGTKKRIFRWLSREHPCMRAAHNLARHRAGRGRV